MFITFEGIDSSGKSTQCAFTIDWLRSLNKNVLVVREPGGTDISERVRSILLDKKHLNMDSITELLLFSAARSQLVQESILPALNKGDIVVADRFFDSTTAYQGYGRGIPLDTIFSINDLSSHKVVPDVTFFLDISYSESIARQEKHGNEHDRIEQASEEFFMSVRKGYHSLATTDKGRFHILDGTLPKEQISATIREVVLKRLKRK